MVVLDIIQKLLGYFKHKLGASHLSAKITDLQVAISGPIKF
jgi:hypothetical protein